MRSAELFAELALRPVERLACSTDENHDWIGTHGTLFLRVAWGERPKCGSSPGVAYFDEDHTPLSPELAHFFELVAHRIAKSAMILVTSAPREARLTQLKDSVALTVSRSSPRDAHLAMSDAANAPRCRSGEPMSPAKTPISAS
jgi:hypothetical protein